MTRRSAATVDDVYTRLKQRIVSGAYAAEQPLSQLQLAQELGTSRTPLREAFRLLERDGLIVSAHNKRFRVASFGAEDLEELYVLRIAVETTAARFSVPLLDESDLEAMTEFVAEMDQAVEHGSYDRWRDPHLAFHGRLLTHAGARPQELAQRLSEHAERYRYASTLPVSPTSWAQAHCDHHGLFAAAIDRDGELAAERLAAHYGRVALSVLSFSAPLHDPRMLRMTLSQAMQGSDPQRMHALEPARQ